MFLTIDEKSSKPKYKQIVDSIIAKISDGSLKIGEKIPSINELSEDCYLSRDTVEKAYRQLKEKKAIVSVKGKGFYTVKTELISKVNVFFLINKLSSYKMRLYNSFVNSMGVNAHINLFIYHCDESLFLNLINKHIGGYDYYIIMSHFKDDKRRYVESDDAIIKAIKKIPTNQLVLLDNQFSQIKGDYINIYQDFKLDIYDSLNQGIEKLAKYKKIVLVYPTSSEYPYPKDIIIGFKRFCIEHFFNFEVIDQIYKDMDFDTPECFIVIDEMDLVYLVRQAREKNLTLGKDIGIISYNETPLKDLLGITVMCTDFKQMGKSTAEMILQNKKGKLKNNFTFIDRNSL